MLIDVGGIFHLCRFAAGIDMSDFYRVGYGMAGGGEGGADRKLPSWDIPLDANRARVLGEIPGIFMLESSN